uniref:Uncharacterized protein n=1 Tax=Arundo donax TaxID=35708 RepID=A0A0A9F6Q4_ARUDO
MPGWRLFCHMMSAKLVAKFSWENSGSLMTLLLQGEKG